MAVIFHSLSGQLGNSMIARRNLRECALRATPEGRFTTMATKTKAKKSNGKTAKPRQSKSAKIVAMLQRPSGVTREQVLKVTGWKAVSMQQMAGNAGIKLKVDESKRPFVYRAA
jgi:hypothetical protein